MPGRRSGTVSIRYLSLLPSFLPSFLPSLPSILLTQISKVCIQLFLPTRSDRYRLFSSFRVVGGGGIDTLRRAGREVFFPFRLLLLLLPFLRLPKVY